MYIKAPAAPFTVNTIPEAMLNALADHGELSGLLPANGGNCEDVLAQFAGAGVDRQALAVRLQKEGADSFVKSWHSLKAVIASKSATHTAATQLFAASASADKEMMLMRVLVVDIGGTNVKILATGQRTPRKLPSGPRLTPGKMVAGVKAAAADWQYDAVAIGYPGRVRNGRIAAQPHNLGRGWVGFNFKSGFGRPVRIVNDAAMPALGSYKRGLLLFPGFGTSLGAALVLDGVVNAFVGGYRLSEAAP